MIITIDGPSGSGKTSVAAELAKRLHFHHFSSSLLYRASAWILFDHAEKKGSKVDFEHLTEDEYQLISAIEYRINKDGIGEIWSEDQNITALLKTEKIAAGASKASADQRVRQLLLSTQRAVAKNNSIIVDGRDCGSVVFPNAEIKIYLSADLLVRALRISGDDQRGLVGEMLSDIASALQVRDERDSRRAFAPLVIPEGAFVVDTTDLSFNQVLQTLLAHILPKID